MSQIPNQTPPPDLADLAAENVRLKAELAQRDLAEAPAQGTDLQVREALSLLAATLEATTDAILVVDLNRKVVMKNARFAEMWRLTPELNATDDAREMAAFTSQLVRDREAFFETVDRVYADASQESFDILTCLDGRVIERYSKPQIADGEWIGRVWSFRDVTEQVNADEELRFYKHILDHCSDAVYWLRPQNEFRFDYVNRAGAKLYGYSESALVGMPAYELTPEFDERACLAALDELQNSQSQTYETLLKPADGAPIPIEISATFVDYGGQDYIAGFVRDLSDRKQLEEELRQAQKMEGIGRLAGGIAHDFNNILTAIIGYSDLAARDAAEGSSLSKCLDHIRNASDRAAELTQQLLAFARKQTIDPKIVNINSLLGETERMLRRLIGADIEIVTSPAAKSASVRLDPGQFQQILVNLGVNARDAMPEGGRLTIETANTVITDSEADKYPGLSPGEYALLTVSDTGLGISEDIRSHIFEPFFTTKPRGKGTGLGLATCYGIVKQSGGHIRVMSEPNQGTSFHILFPVVVQTEGETTKTISTLSLPLGTETVLLVEDEPLVRDIGALTLRSLGYKVLEAGNGVEALAVSDVYIERIDLLVTDVVMPQMGGWELAHQILNRRPTLKVLFTSGYTDNSMMESGGLQEGISFLHKPFTADQLAGKVRATLDLKQRPKGK